MRYSSLTQRIAGDGSSAWDLHYEALERQRQGQPIIMLSVGDPDFETPVPIVEAAIASLRAGHTHYSATLGYQPLRTAIAARFQSRTGLAVSASQVAVLPGAQCALFSAVQCILEAGDEVIVVDPAYVTYEGVFGASGAKMVFVPARPEQGFVVDPSDIEKAITARTKALMINAPHNPTGAVIPQAVWERIAALCIQHDLWLLSDEVYAELVFEGHHLSPATLPGMAERTVTINSLSKSHAMTGWRLGWAIGPNDLISHMGNLGLSMLYGCPPFIQEAACVALSDEMEQTESMRKAYQDRRDAVCRSLEGATGLQCFKPAAGMFVMVDIRKTGYSAAAFAQRLLDEHGVCVLAGEAFGQQTAGHVRIGLVESVDVLTLACDRIKQLALTITVDRPE